MKNCVDLIERLHLWDKKSKKWIQFKLWIIQKKFVLEVLYKRLKVLVLKKRQMGFSQLIGADSMLQCIVNPNTTILILSITSDDAGVFLDRVRDMYKRIPTVEALVQMAKDGKKEYDGIPIDNKYLLLCKIKQMVRCTKGLEAGEEMVWDNGSSLVSLSARKGRGRTADRVVLDEMAFYNLKNSQIKLEDVLRSIEPTLERSGGQLVGITTSDGYGAFYDMWRKAVKKLSSYFPFFSSCWDDPDYTIEKRKQQIADYGINHVRKEYPETAEEAFMSSGTTRFDQEKLLEYEQHLLEPIAVGDIVIEPVTRNRSEYIDHKVILDGSIVFYSPKKKHGQYAMVSDVSEGIERDGNQKDGDYSTLMVFDIETQKKVAEWHGHCEPSELGIMHYKVGYHYNMAMSIIEANNHGIGAITQLRNMGYPPERIFQGKHIKTKSDDKYNKPNKRYGFLTTSSSKPLIIDNLAIMLVRYLLQELTYEDISEMRTYMRDNAGRTNADENCYDDRVMTLAIFYYVVQFLVLVPIDKYSYCEHCIYYSRDDRACSVNQHVRELDDWCVMHDAIDYEGEIANMTRA